ncbi:hypothetical protein GCM10010294_69230 [Streptomyces griseoloalbus]|nr:hypothetical protein GCM10010294_69230 [Streptomyces griseoloalbus]
MRNAGRRGAGHRTPDGFGRLLNSSVWDAEALRDDVRAYVGERLGPDGVLIIDDGFVKKTTARRKGPHLVRAGGRPWSPPLEDRVLRVAACRRTNLTWRQPASPFGMAKSAAGRIVRQPEPSLALWPGSRFSTAGSPGFQAWPAP